MRVLVEKSPRHWIQRILVLALCVTLLPSAALMPTAVQAETSADPDEEIVYIDNGGFIRVLDTLQTGGNPRVDWVSQTGGWEHFVLGDVNNDGDQEIIAIKEESGVGTLTVWDPVVATGPFDGKSPNGIPWAKLYEISIPGNPKIVATGKLDPNLPGDHIVYGYQVSPTVHQLVVLKPATATPNGREWATHFTRDFNELWDAIWVGNIDNTGADEISLVDRTQGRLSVFRADNQSSAILNRTGSARPWRIGLIAQYDGDKGKEVIAIRNGDILPSFYVLEYDNGDFEEPVDEVFTPSPRFAFAADINDDGQEEIVMLRSTSVEDGIRMIVRSNSQKNVPTELEQALDEDNGYESGAGGDVDGDGKDEIVIIRDNNIRVYNQPDRDASFSNYGASTNKDSIHIGDLDRNGFVIGSQLGATVSTIEEELGLGATGVSKQIELRNLTTLTPIPFNIAVENNPSWLEVTPRTGNTPAIITYRANAVGLAAGEYTTRLVITSSDPTVINQPFYIQVKLKAVPALIEPRPTDVVFGYLASQEPVTLTQNISILGTDAVKFTVAIASLPAVQSAAAALQGDFHTGYVTEDGQVVVQDDYGNETTLEVSSVNAPNAVPWLTVTPTEGTIPAVLSVTATSSLQTQDFEQAYIVIVGDARTGKPPQNIRLITVTALRASSQLFMPITPRN